MGQTLSCYCFLARSHNSSWEKKIVRTNIHGKREKNWHENRLDGLAWVANTSLENNLHRTQGSGSYQLPFPIRCVTTYINELIKILVRGAEEGNIFGEVRWGDWNRLDYVRWWSVEKRGEGTGEWDHYVNHNLPSWGLTPGMQGEGTSDSFRHPL